MSATFTLNVNGQNHPVTVNNPAMPLLWVLRDLLGLTGTKYGCGENICGACTVLANNVAIRSCITQVQSVAGQAIVTIEGLSPNSSHPAQLAWIANQVPQCGYCQSGQIMSTAAAMLAGNRGNNIAPHVHNVCICGTYNRILKAMGTL
ncbi:MAG TPA: (2Fe-2S)-binding protein [Bryobacteraceae bacterium]|jgi:isoquinoline 1-oxidoreductase alpha subunit